jgi:hypothetical protein
MNEHALATVVVTLVTLGLVILIGPLLQLLGPEERVAAGGDESR